MERILSLLEEVTEDTGALRALCLVSRAFNAVFTRKLYTTLELGSWNICVILNSDKRRYTIKSGNLAYTRNFRLLGASNLDDTYLHTADGRQALNDALAEVLKHTCALRVFSSFSALLTEATMIALTEIASLEVVDITFHSHGVTDFDPFPARSSEFRGLTSVIQPFGNLQRLRLHNIWGDISRWRGFLAKVLNANRRLQHLSLALAKDTKDQIENSGSCNCFFDDICRGCVELDGPDRQGSRLGLKSLRLYGPVCFPRIERLAEVTDVALLEDVFICTDPDEFDIFYIPPDFLSLEVTPNLRFVSLSCINEDVWDELPGAMLGRAGLKAHGFSLDDVDPEASIYELARRVRNVPMLKIPRGVPGEVDMRSEIHHLQGCIWLTHLILNLEAYEGPHEPSLLEYCLPSLCQTLATLPNLEALWVTDDHDPKGARKYSLDEMSTAIQKIADGCRSLRYARIGQTSFLVKSTPQPALTLLHHWQDDLVAPEFFCNDEV